jgi:hypothetical protein
MDNLEIMTSDVTKILSQLKVGKSPWIDKMHPRFLREVANSISTPLTLLFNLSKREEKLQDEWKKATRCVVIATNAPALSQSFKAMFRPYKKNVVFPLTL